jgi:dolichyl-phosphate-mannose--protein O-mannosyl transferase
METPLNEKQRNLSIVKFIIACFVCIIFLAYHVFISINAYHTDFSKTDVPNVESGTQESE